VPGFVLSGARLRDFRYRPSGINNLNTDSNLFIYPLGEEHGFDAIERNVFEKVMGGMFSTRDLKMHDVAIYVNGDSAWSEFRWDFHATLRKDGSAVTTHGVETQVYRKENAQWRLVHVHYSEDRQAIL
jgi:ketosteroid isomerase-like protein